MVNWHHDAGARATEQNLANASPGTAARRTLSQSQESKSDTAAYRAGHTDMPVMRKSDGDEMHRDYDRNLKPPRDTAAPPECIATTACAA